jgi:hypothetical protein
MSLNAGTINQNFSIIICVNYSHIIESHFKFRGNIEAVEGSPIGDGDDSTCSFPLSA